MRSFLSYIIIMMCIIGCHSDQKLTKEDKLRIADTIELTLNNYFKDIKASGLKAELKYLDTSSDFFWVPPGYSSAISYDSVAEILNRNAPYFKSIENAFDTLRINTLSRRLATYTAKINTAITDTSGKISIMQLIESGVMIKRTDGWKLLSGQTAVVDEKE